MFIKLVHFKCLLKYLPTFIVAIAQFIIDNKLVKLVDIEKAILAAIVIWFINVGIAFVVVL